MMFGDLQAKLQGMQHLAVNYFGTIPDPLRLCAPLSNRECLGCHAGARNYEERVFHAAILRELEQGDPSCLESHSAVHAIEDLDELPTWNRTTPAQEVP